MTKTIKRPKDKTPDDCKTMWQPHSGCTCTGYNKGKKDMDVYHQKKFDETEKELGVITNDEATIIIILRKAMFGERRNDEL